jgi:hypothetical protein
MMAVVFGAVNRPTPMPFGAATANTGGEACRQQHEEPKLSQDDR